MTDDDRFPFINGLQELYTCNLLNSLYFNSKLGISCFNSRPKGYSSCGILHFMGLFFLDRVSAGNK